MRVRVSHCHCISGARLGRERWHEHGRDIRRRRIGQPSLGRADAPKKKSKAWLRAGSIRRSSSEARARVKPVISVHSPSAA